MNFNVFFFEIDILESIKDILNTKTILQNGQKQLNLYESVLKSLSIEK